MITSTIVQTGHGALNKNGSYTLALTGPFSGSSEKWVGTASGMLYGPSAKETMGTLSVATTLSPLHIQASFSPISRFRTAGADGSGVHTLSSSTTLKSASHSQRAAHRPHVLRHARDEVGSWSHPADAILVRPHPELVERRTGRTAARSLTFPTASRRSGPSACRPSA
jgi:hypothetical protein